ncbi:D-alanyl-D-alanine dipeptidase [Anatilimnocola aggregata]|uniref:D-alanyl-D-alanine dipeptidase n=2 Tax=Anatilimnocola aggregata TaxID=2528021 RepID=A0A517Y4B6_9BACT|nr:D-alanyl-D-alanine dipeptidase [Anatilimnocola aggregata]
MQANNTMTTCTDEVARRAYWAEQMQLGYELVQQILPFEVAECGEGFASLRDAAETAGIEMLFSDTKIAGELDRVFFMRESLVQAVMDVGRDMNQRGWILKIEDGYRSLEMQGSLVRKPELFDSILKKCIWEIGGEIPSAEFVFRRAIVLIANIPKIGTHMSGSAIDVSVFRRDEGSEVWRGRPYLEMSEQTPMRSPFVDEDSLRNRLEITAMLEARGFVHFPFEFWHFNQGDALGNILSGRAAPARFGPVHWDPRTNRVTPVDDPLSPLNPLPVIEREIASALQRATDRVVVV